MADEPWYKVEPIQDKKLFEDAELPDLLQVQAKLVKAQQLLNRESKSLNKAQSEKPSTNNGVQLQTKE